MAVRFEGAGKRFGRSSVFGDVCLEVKAGSFFGLAGVNGAGKTTLIKCMLDFCSLDEGRVEIFGKSHLARGARSGLCYLPERFNPPYYLKGGDFLDYALKLQGKSVAREAVHSLLEEIDLAQDALSRPVRMYSKGMTQKLGLSACFLSGKDLLVLDEPMSGLDPKARALVKRKLRRLHEAGKTLLFTSHSLEDMGDLCDSMALLHEGKILFSGAPREFCGDSFDMETAFLERIGGASCISTISG